MTLPALPLLWSALALDTHTVSRLSIPLLESYLEVIRLTYKFKIFWHSFILMGFVSNFYSCKQSIDVLNKYAKINDKFFSLGRILQYMSVLFFIKCGICAHAFYTFSGMVSTMQISSPFLFHLPSINNKGDIIYCDGSFCYVGCYDNFCDSFWWFPEIKNELKNKIWL